MRKIVLGFVFLTITIGNVFGQEWEKVGPSGGDMQYIVANDSVAVVSVQGKGVYFSHNNGAYWESSPIKERVYGLLMENNLIVVTTERKLYYSIDHCKTFKNYELSFEASSYGTYLKDGKIYLSGYWSGNIMSSDTGKTWVPINKSFDFLRIDQNVWYAVRNSYGLAISQDNGNTWKQDSTLMGTYINFIEVDSGKVWLGIKNELFYSENNGNTWTVKYSSPDSIGPLKSLKKYNNTLHLAGDSKILTSTDNGNNWNAVPAIKPFGGYSFYNFAWANNTNYQIGWLGIYLSNNGISWKKSDNGIFHSNITNLKVADNLLLYSINQHEVGFSIDKGNSFKRCEYIDSTDGGFNWAEFSNGVLYASDWHYGIFFSIDTGKIWKSMNFPQSLTYWTGGIFFNNNTLYISYLNYLNNSDKIYRTQDKGLTWDSYIFPNSVQLIERHFAKSEKALVYGRIHMYKSINNGNTWTKCSLISEEYNDLKFSGTYFYASSWYGVLRSKDDAEIWENILPDPNLVYPKIATYGNNIYVSSGYKIFYSNNDGDSWQEISFLHPIQDLDYIHPYLFVATKDESIWRVNTEFILDLNEKIEKNSVVLSPNPTSGKFTLKLKVQTKEVKVCVYNVLGNCILTQQINNSENQEIDLSEKAKGIYFVEIDSGKEKINRKVVVN